MKAYERFMRYIQLDTSSSSESESCPSTTRQLVLGELLVGELRALGAADARLDEYGYVYASIPANADGQSAIGLIAHVDTVDCVPALPMKARVVKYEGGDVALEGGEALRAEEFEALASHIGEDLIVTDGNTLLGADDKAGIAEIITLLEYVDAHPEYKHGKICVAFTPDEEIGRGADRFDVAGFGAEYAYTVDGGTIDEVEYENFNAAGARVTVNGVSIHPGAAKNKMRNAILVAMEFNALLPPAETPSHTEGYEGFYHIGDIRGSEEKCEMRYIIRDHDMAKFAARKASVLRAAEYINAKYAAPVVEVDMKDSYYNMKERFKDCMHVVERALDAMREAGLSPKTVPIRGGTDGARLSFMGLPCPNLPTGGMNAHGRFECVSIQDMDKVVEILKNILRARV